MRTIIRDDGHNHCFLAYEDEFGQVREYDFYAASNGGYVYYADYSGDKQICEKLNHRGATLLWSGKEKLVDLIRREYRRMRAQERRDYIQRQIGGRW